MEQIGLMFIGLIIAIIITSLSIERKIEELKKEIEKLK